MLDVSIVLEVARVIILSSSKLFNCYCFLAFEMNNHTKNMILIETLTKTCNAIRALLTFSIKSIDLSKRKLELLWSLSIVNIYFISLVPVWLNVCERFFNYIKCFNSQLIKNSILFMSRSRISKEAYLRYGTVFV